jgi:nitrogen fixation/metabolism regulation signal transduction histidine kinase
LVLTTLVLSVVPLAGAVYVANSMLRQAASLWFNPAIGQQLDRGVDLYKDYVRVVKDDLRHQAQVMARDPALERDTKLGGEALRANLQAKVAENANLAKLEVVKTSDEEALGEADRGRPVDDALERSLRVVTPMDDPGYSLVATFVVNRARLDELERGGQVVTTYHQVEASRSELYATYTNAFAAIFGMTVLVTGAVGYLLARGVTRRITRLSLATQRVAGGDLSVRVPVTGSDELTELAAAFNTMTREVGESRAKVEFLQRMGAWQEMAQRLAHEIKNPLTPIQLAVQECHRRYEGGDTTYAGLLDTTLEVVEEEVGTLRRLVGNFSNFARLPRAELQRGDLAQFLRECREHRLDEAGQTQVGASSGQAADVTWEVPDHEVPCELDRQMLRRVVVNLVENALQARRATDTPTTRVRVGLEVHGEDARIVVEDNGPGVGEDVRQRIFEPYFTTKKEGTGLGLAIVKKIVVEHQGDIDVESSSLGGARFVVRLPLSNGVAQSPDDPLKYAPRAPGVS